MANFKLFVVCSSLVLLQSCGEIQEESAPSIVYLDCQYTDQGTGEYNSENWWRWDDFRLSLREAEGKATLDGANGRLSVDAEFYPDQIHISVPQNTLIIDRQNGEFSYNWRYYDDDPFPKGGVCEVLKQSVERKF